MTVKPIPTQILIQRRTQALIMVDHRPVGSLDLLAMQASLPLEACTLDLELQEVPLPPATCFSENGGMTRRASA